MALAIPLYLLYEVCIAAARLHERAVGRRRPALADDPDTPSPVDPRPSTL